MTTSGSTVFSLTRDQIITAAVRKTGRLASGGTLTSNQLSEGTTALNGVTALLQTIGVPLWARDSTQFPLTLDVGTYTIGTGLTVNVPAPLKILQAFSVNTTTSYGVQMEIVSIFDNTANVLVTSGSLPVQLSYQPQVDTGIITIWPRPDSIAVAGIQIKIVYQAPFEMFISGTDTMDLPKEWHQPLIYLLAVALAPEYGVPLQDRQLLKKECDEYMERASAFGQEDGSMYFAPRRM
jgi:hypothetical protein